LARLSDPIIPPLRDGILFERIDAIAEYEATLTINPNYSDAHNNLGAVLLQKGELDQAIDH
jgi:Tfp pilus assembly protein PilF